MEGLRHTYYLAHEDKFYGIYATNDLVCNILKREYLARVPETETNPCPESAPKIDLNESLDYRPRVGEGSSIYVANGQGFRFVVLTHTVVDSKIKINTESISNNDLEQELKETGYFNE